MKTFKIAFLIRRTLLVLWKGVQMWSLSQTDFTSMGGHRHMSPIQMYLKMSWYNPWYTGFWLCLISL